MPPEENKKGVLTLSKMKEFWINVYMLISRVVVFSGTLPLVMMMTFGLQFLVDGEVVPRDSDGILALVISLLLSNKIFDIYVMKDAKEFIWFGNDDEHTLVESEEAPADEPDESGYITSEVRR